ncbi:putative sulfatase [Escherichia coli]|nr:putative sulfatase [Escherichia coli]
MDGILSTRTPAALITALNQQGYQLGLFSSDGFTSPLYRQALLSDFSMPSVRTQSDEQTATQWINWLGRYAQEDNRWFSWVSFNGTNIDDSNQQAFARKYSRRQAMSMTRSTACSMHCVILANWTIRW